MNYFILIKVILFYFISFQFPLINSLSTVSISITNNQTLICAITNPSILNCTSYPSGIQFPIINSHNVFYSSIVGGNGFLCGIRLQSSQSVMDCWRFLDIGKKITHKRIYKGPILSEIVSGNSHICGIVNTNTNTNTNTSSNNLNCWQWREWNSNSKVPIFSRIAIGDDFLCGIVKNNGSIYCLGNGNGNNNVIKSYPNGNFSVISAGKNYACVIELNGNLQCWGNIVGSKPEGVFKDLALGDEKSCAIRDNGMIVCWGSDEFKVPKALEKTYFIGVVAKGSVFCGVVATNFSLVCWGNEVIDKNMLVFSSVMPGECVSECPSCGPLPGSSDFCGKGLMVCQPCDAVMGPNVGPLPPPGLDGKKSSGGNWNGKMIVYLVVGCLGSVCWVAIVVVLVWRYCKSKGCRVHDSGPIELVPNTQESRDEHDEFGELPVAPTPVLEKRFSHMYSIDRGGSLEEFTLEVLLEVTQNFSHERRIGIGSFGSVYHATLDDGREVAIKRAEVLSRTNALGTNRRQEDKDVAFMAELDVLSRLNHKHLVKLIGFFEDANERVLVYEFLNNFTLHDHLHKLKDSSPLASWPNRIRVALDAARGIDYLHAYAVPPIIHRDIKPSNILLDDTWTAKVSDFGLSLMGPQEGESHLSLMAAGTFGYVDPEYYKLHQLTTKSDVYSFGVVLLEILSGFKAIHINEDGTPRNVVDYMVPYIIRGDIHRVLDPNVPPPTPVEIEAVMLVGDLAVDCVSLEGRNRPSMSNVVSFLERALAACLVRPTFSSSSEASSR
ncbi:serine/threonine-protein kinase-like protein CCR4 [Silene latifolia]|uniref:serine/threonine-protein kinase-like protein CCR4 n=1 Tax=Silene latifolia TaxID=37657 RepID=UPI003D77EDEE